MKRIIFVILLCSSWSANSQPSVYYITPSLPDSGNCTINGTMLTSCYTMEQFASIWHSSYSSSITLLFLPGTHELSGNNTFIIFNLQEVNFRTWDDQQEVVIECQKANIILQNIPQLNIRSLHFKSCSLQCIYELSNLGIDSLIFLDYCIFEGSKHNYAIVITSEHQTLYFSVTYCRFVLNTAGAIASNSTRLAFVYLTNLFISDTVFQGNGGDELSLNVMRIETTMLTVYNGVFINNKGNAIIAITSSLELSNTTFAKTHGTSLALLESSANLENCYFLDNFVKKYGTVVVLTQQTHSLSFSNIIFRQNHASKGGAFYIEGAGITVTNCQFDNNTANSGGAIYMKGRETECNMINSTFIHNEVKHNGGAVYCS